MYEDSKRGDLNFRSPPEFKKYAQPDWDPRACDGRTYGVLKLRQFPEKLVEFFEQSLCTLEV